jgi:hypothetical protein
LAIWRIKTVCRSKIFYNYVVGLFIFHMMWFTVLFRSIILNYSNLKSVWIFTYSAAVKYWRNLYQTCTIPLLPWRVNDLFGRVKWPKHSINWVSKFFSNAHLFSSENEIFSHCLQNTIRFLVYQPIPVYSERFWRKGNSSDLLLSSLGFTKKRGCKCTYFPSICQNVDNV